MTEEFDTTNKQKDTKMNDIKTIAWGLLLLLTIALAHTICYELDEAAERDTSSNSTAYIKDHENTRLARRLQ